VFTVHFWKDRVILDGENLPMGQITADILNLSEEQILALRYKANETYGLFRMYVTALLDFYFERLKGRNEEYYAVHSVLYPRS